MANASQLFKDDEDERSGHIPSDDELRHITGIGPAAETAMEDQAKAGADDDARTLAEKEQAAGRAQNDNAPPRSLSDVKDGEKKEAGDSFYNPNKDAKQGVRQRFRSRISNIAKNKLLLGGAIAGGGVIAILLLLLLFLSSLKLPSIMQNIATYEFAQVSRQFAKSAQNVTDETVALDATPDSVYSKLKARFTANETYQNIRDTTWGRLDAYRPSKVIQNLGNDNGLTFHYRSSNIPGRSPIFTGATIDNVRYDVEPVTGVAKWIPGVRQLVGAKNQAAWRNSFMPKVMETERVSNLGPVMRFRVSLAIREEAGSGFAGWVLDKFVGKSGAAADTEAAQELAQASERGMTVPDNAVTDELRNADAAAEQDMQQEATNAAAAKKVVEQGGDSTQVANDVGNAVKQSTFDKALGVVSGVYGVAVPLCIIYDGSVQQSQPAIDNQMNEQENVFDKLAAEADQQKQGTINPSNDTALANAIQGTSDNLGNVDNSIPYQRAAGANVSTADQLGAEAAAGGGYTYSVFNLLGVSPGSTMGKLMNDLVGSVCPALTSPWVAGAFAAANIAAFGLSLGSSGAVEETGAQVARTTATDIAKSFVKAAIEKLTAKTFEKDGQKVIARTALNRAMRFAFKQGIIVGGTVGLTEFANLEVASRSGYASNGFAQGKDQVNIADSGANIEANRLEQQQLFGRPMTASEVAQSDQENSTFIANNNASLSFAKRYFSTSNPNSLVTRVAMTLGSNLRLSLFQKIIQLGASFLQPFNSLLSLLHLSGVAHAAPTPGTQHYGNVQFGWTQDEENLINSSDSYKPLENQQILDQSGQETAIAQTYASCFGYKYDASGNGDLDPTDTNGDLKRDPNASLGHLLANQDIKRDSSGNVVDDPGVLCSPTNLGPNNPTYHDLVFRWRLAMQYDTTADQLIGEQNVTAS